MRKLTPIIVFALLLVISACSSATPTTAPAPTQPPATIKPASAQPTTAPVVSSSPSSATSSQAASSPSGDTVKLVMVAGKNEARYRVREQLAGVNLPNDAIGVTKEITGVIVGKLDGTIVSSQSMFRVNLSTLKSDRDQRDNFLRRNTLETDKFPFAEFVPVEAPGLPLKLPADGKVAFKLIGDMTVHGTTKRVTWDAQGTVTGDEATGTATTSFNFAYFNLVKPSVPVVLSIEDNIKLEMGVTLKRQP